MAGPAPMAAAGRRPASRPWGLLLALAALPRAALRPLFGNLGWPIVLKEIRSDFRKNRFFVTHLVCLGAMAAGVLWSVVAQSEGSDVRPEDIGRSIFNVFFMIQCLVVLVVFPAFSSSAVSEERTARTFDLLATTGLKPEEVIWGKFLASSIYCLIYIVATVPLLSVSLLFAGVTLGEIGIAYAVLIGLTVLLSMGGVFVSSCFERSLRATLTLYVASFGILAWWWFGVDDSVWKNQALAIAPLVQSLSASGSVLWSLAGLLVAFGILFAYLFVFASNRIRPTADDRSSKLRALTVTALGVWLAWELTSLQGVQESKRPGEFQEPLFVAAAALFVAGLLFTSEPASVAPRLRRQFARWSGPWFPLRVFAPGPFWGLVYSVFLGVLCAAALWRFGVRALPEAELPRYQEYVLTIPLYLFAFAALGLFLSTLDFTPGYTRLTVLFVFIISCLLPVIFEIGGKADGIFALYYLSPVSLWKSLEPNKTPGDGPSYLLWDRTPIIEVARWLFGALGVLFLALGARRARRKGYPRLAFEPRSPKPAPQPVPAGASPPATGSPGAASTEGRG